AARLGRSPGAARRQIERPLQQQLGRQGELEREPLLVEAQALWRKRAQRHVRHAADLDGRAGRRASSKAERLEIREWQKDLPFLVTDYREFASRLLVDA